MKMDGKLKFKKRLEDVLQEIETRRLMLHDLRINKNIVRNYGSCPIHETDFEIKLLFPLLTLLDWDIYSEDVLIEAPIKRNGENLKRVDLVLCEKEKYKIVIDYKKSGKFNKNWTNQIKNYFLNSDAQYGMIITPQLMKFYWKKGNVKTRSCSKEVFTLFFDREEVCSVLNYVDVFSILRKDFVSNKLDKFFKENYQKKAWEKREKTWKKFLPIYNCNKQTELFSNDKYRLDVMREALIMFHKDYL